MHYFLNKNQKSWHFQSFRIWHTHKQQYNYNPNDKEHLWPRSFGIPTGYHWEELKLNSIEPYLKEKGQTRTIRQVIDEYFQQLKSILEKDKHGWRIKGSFSDHGYEIFVIKDENNEYSWTFQ